MAMFSIIFLVIPLLPATQAWNCFQWERQPSFDGFITSSSYIQTSSAHSAIECAAQCCNEKFCAGFIHAEPSAKCQLLSTYLPWTSVDLVSEHKAGYYTIVTDCPGHWHIFRRSCYEFIEVETNITAAQDLCQTANAHLVHVNDQEENQFVQSVIQGYTRAKWWLGLSDSDTEGVYKWMDDDSILQATDFAGWGVGFPKGRNSADCVIFTHHDDYMWHDTYCHGEDRHVICERDMV